MTPSYGDPDPTYPKRSDLFDVLRAIDGLASFNQKATILNPNQSCLLGRDQLVKDPKIHQVSGITTQGFLRTPAIVVQERRVRGPLG